MVETRVIAGLALAMVVLGGVAFAFSGDTPTGQVSSAELESFAQCLSDENATFYGAFWCPACNEQKATFGSAVDELDYVECSPNGQGSPQAEVCQEKGITSYPTWIIDGERYDGEIMSLQQLADATGCTPP